MKRMHASYSDDRIRPFPGAVLRIARTGLAQIYESIHSVSVASNCFGDP